MKLGNLNGLEPYPEVEDDYIDFMQYSVNRLEKEVRYLHRKANKAERTINKFIRWGDKNMSEAWSTYEERQERFTSWQTLVNEWREYEEKDKEIVKDKIVVAEKMIDRLIEQGNIMALFLEVAVPSRGNIEVAKWNELVEEWEREKNEG